MIKDSTDLGNKIEKLSTMSNFGNIRVGTQKEGESFADYYERLQHDEEYMKLVHKCDEMIEKAHKAADKFKLEDHFVLEDMDSMVAQRIRHLEDNEPEKIYIEPVGPDSDRNKYRVMLFSISKDESEKVKINEKDESGDENDDKKDEEELRVKRDLATIVDYFGLDIDTEKENEYDVMDAILEVTCSIENELNKKVNLKSYNYSGLFAFDSVGEYYGLIYEWYDTIEISTDTIRFLAREGIVVMIDGTPKIRCGPINRPPTDCNCEICNRKIDDLPNFNIDKDIDIRLVKNYRSYRGCVGASWECKDCIMEDNY